MRTKKQLPAADTLAAFEAAQSKTEGAKTSQVLRSCRLQYQNPATFEVTSVYITRTDARRFRAKIFRGGKCQLAQYVDGDDFLEVLQKVNDYIN